MDVNVANASASTAAQATQLQASERAQTSAPASSAQPDTAARAAPAAQVELSAPAQAVLQGESVQRPADATTPRPAASSALPTQSPPTQSPSLETLSEDELFSIAAPFLSTARGASSSPTEEGRQTTAEPDLQQTAEARRAESEQAAVAQQAEVTPSTGPSGNGSALDDPLQFS